uniref:Ig-like domain-containing protein n=1 Tax=Podarcis muralis TaxID=64176 RepID=A0A670IP13_PODMU
RCKVLFILQWYLARRMPRKTKNPQDERVFGFFELLRKTIFPMGLLRKTETSCKFVSFFLKPLIQLRLDFEEQLIARLPFHFFYTPNNSFQHPDPFVVQSLIFCESTSNGTTRGFYDAALEGESIVTFSADNGSWVALQDNAMAAYVQQILNGDKGTAGTLQKLLLGQCIGAHNTFLETGKEAVFTHKTPPAPDSLLLVCRVTGFYPRPINVSWLQDDKELPSSDFNSTEILPNHDLTYQIRSTLVIKSADEHSYACRVQHISLGVKIIPWGRYFGYRKILKFLSCLLSQLVY